MIQKMVIAGKGSTRSKFQFRGLGFTQLNNGVWEDVLFSATNVTTDNISEYVSDKYLATSNLKVLSYNSRWHHNLFDGNLATTFSFQSNGDFELNITFTTPIPAIKNIIYNFYSRDLSNYYINSVKIYDENDGEIFSDSSTWISNPTTSDSTTINYLPTPSLCITYPVNTVGTIETTDANHLTNVSSIDLLDPNQQVLDATDIRYLLSFDGRQTYKAYDNTTGDWVNVDKTDIMTKGMSRDKLILINSSKYALAIDSNYKTLDILVGLITTDPIKTPSISSIDVTYYKN